MGFKLVSLSLTALFTSQGYLPLRINCRIDFQKEIVGRSQVKMAQLMCRNFTVGLFTEERMVTC